MSTKDIKQSRGRHTKPGFKLSHIRGDMGGGSTGTWPHFWVCTLLKTLFFLQSESKGDQTEVRAKLTSAANINIKTMTHLILFEAALVSLLLKPPTLTNTFKILRSWFDISTFILCLYVIFVSSDLTQSDLCWSHFGVLRVYCPGTYGQLMELPDSCMSRISVSMGVLPTRRMKKSWEMRFAGTARRAGRRSSKRPKRCGWFGYCNLSYSVRATWAFSCRDSTWAGSVSPHASVRGEKTLDD